MEEAREFDTGAVPKRPTTTPPAVKKAHQYESKGWGRICKVCQHLEQINDTSQCEGAPT
jgi:hypothetical protein